MPHKYVFSQNKVVISGESQNLEIDLATIAQALQNTNNSIDVLKENAPDLFGILGMRNLSAFIGEMFVSSLAKVSKNKLIKNPHQDGYPDLLAMTQEGITLWNTLSVNLQDKKPFSGFGTGGMEVKATCGSVPTPEYFRKKGLLKPDIGQQRIEFSRGYDWKAHHRETNNLMGIYWDFVDGKPAICALFFSSDLCEEDWGEIIQPKKGGGRTTSVSIMTRAGVKKMYTNWIAVIEDARYVNFLNAYNQSNLIVL